LSPSATSSATSPKGNATFSSSESHTEQAFDVTKRQLMARGCTEEEADHALSLLLGMGVPPSQLGQWADDLWNMVETALDGVFDG